jgi:hypothetical protein
MKNVRLLYFFFQKTFCSLSLVHRWHPHVIISKQYVPLPKMIRSVSAKPWEAAGSMSGHAFSRLPIHEPALAKPTDEATPFGSIE